MQLPTITVLSTNFTEVTVNGIQVYYSYSTPVAFQIPGHGLVVHQNDWSATTGKHLNKIDGGQKKTRVDSQTFMKMWEEQSK